MESVLVPPSESSRDLASRSSFVYELIFSCNKSVYLIWERIRTLGLNNPPNVAMVVRIDNWRRLARMKSEFQKQMLVEELLIAVKDASADLPDTLAAIVDEDAVALLTSIHQYEHSSMKDASVQVAEKLLASVQKRLAKSVTIGIGSPYEDPRNLRLSYKEALRAEQRKFFLGKGRVIHFEDIGEPDPFSPSDMFSLDELELFSELKRGNAAGALDSLSELLRWMRRMSARPDVVKLFMMKVLILMGNAAVEGCGAKTDIQKAQVAAAVRLAEAETAEEIEEWIRGVTFQLVELVNKALSDHNRRAIYSALEYMHKNFWREITLSEIAAYVHLSPSYFSRVFKDQMGESFIEYLKKLRIGKAKELLAEGRRSVQEVSEAVGYKDPRYFSKVFKSLVGLSPCAYRMYG